MRIFLPLPARSSPFLSYINIKRAEQKFYPFYAGAGKGTCFSRAFPLWFPQKLRKALLVFFDHCISSARCIHHWWHSPHQPQNSPLDCFLAYGKHAHFRSLAPNSSPFLSYINIKRAEQKFYPFYAGAGKGT